MEERRIEKVGTPRILFVIDGSGSMGPGEEGKPFYLASHLSRALKEELGGGRVKVCICNNSTSTDKPILVTDWSVPQRYDYDHAEGLRKVKPLLTDKFDVMFFFTDGAIDKESWETIESVRRKAIVVYCGEKYYMDNIKRELEERKVKGIAEKDLLTLVRKVGRLMQKLHRGRV